MQLNKIIRCELPYPPSVNHYYRHVGSRVLISRDGRNYRDQVAMILAVCRIRPLVGTLELKVDLYPPDRRRRDMDNVLKALWDALQHGGAYTDDSQIEKFALEKYAPVAGGKVIVRLSNRGGEVIA